MKIEDLMNHKSMEKIISVHICTVSIVAGNQEMPIIDHEIPSRKLPF